VAIARGRHGQCVPCAAANTRHRHEVRMAGGHDAREGTDPRRGLRRRNVRVLDPISRQIEREPLPWVGSRRLRGDIRKKPASNLSIPSTKLPGRDRKPVTVKVPIRIDAIISQAPNSSAPICQASESRSLIAIFHPRGSHPGIPPAMGQVPAPPSPRARVKDSPASCPVSGSVTWGLL